MAVVEVAAAAAAMAVDSAVAMVGVATVAAMAVGSEVATVAEVGP